MFEADLPHDNNGQPMFYLYGDKGYDHKSAYVVTPCDLEGIAPGIYERCNSARVSVENVFGAAKGTC